MLRRCLTCGTPIRSGSRCKPCAEAYRPAAARTALPRATLNRDNHRCRTCGSPATASNPLVAHHIVPLTQGGSNTLDNMITLCRRCHAEEHRRLRDLRAARSRRN